jgi:hypothetical protein
MVDLKEALARICVSHHLVYHYHRAYHGQASKMERLIQLILVDVRLHFQIHGFLGRRTPVARKRSNGRMSCITGELGINVLESAQL